MDTLDRIAVDISVVLGTADMPIHQLLRMGRGAVIELETHENDDVQILANNVSVGRGQVVVKGEQIAVQISEMLLRDPTRR